MDINSQQDGHLLLSAITLPGSAMQRKVHEDKADLEMRSFFQEVSNNKKRTAHEETREAFAGLWGMVGSYTHGCGRAT